jgi:hypothetical protein
MPCRDRLRLSACYPCAPASRVAKHLWRHGCHWRLQQQTLRLSVPGKRVGSGWEGLGEGERGALGFRPVEQLGQLEPGEPHAPYDLEGVWAGGDREDV